MGVCGGGDRVGIQNNSKCLIEEGEETELKDTVS